MCRCGHSPEDTGVPVIVCVSTRRSEHAPPLWPRAMGLLVSPHPPAFTRQCQKSSLSTFGNVGVSLSVTLRWRQDLCFLLYLFPKLKQCLSPVGVALHRFRWMEMDFKGVLQLWRCFC